MLGFEIMPLLGIALVSITAAAGAILVLGPKTPGQAGRPGWVASGSLGTAVWIFDGTRLIDRSAGTEAYCEELEYETAWAALHDRLVTRFAGFPEDPLLVREDGPLFLPASDGTGPAWLSLEWIDGITRVRLGPDKPPPRESAPGLPQSVSDEMRNLREAVNRTPNPIWRVSSDGKVIWSNHAYNRLEARIAPENSASREPVFPLPSGSAECPRRLPAVVPGSEKKLWYDVAAVAEGNEPLFHAVNVDAVVDAEDAQRKFVQTLAKTFAQLSIGLAIFDRNHQLALFNPALIDLTTLSAEFLSAKPNLLTFFDRLRDQRMMPEPKNYASWRHQMADLVEAASDGRYQETWTLPSGSVYSVSGRPHPDGAIAFLIEDITAEITLTRRFRADLELGQSIIDGLTDAVAVFSADGSLTVTNAAYRSLWAVDPDISFAQVSVVDATRTWQDRCKATPVWGEIRDFVAVHENRTDWWAEIRLLSGEPLTCQVRPIQSGATLILFSREKAAPAARRTQRPELIRQR